jgi:hypothetical protein
VKKSDTAKLGQLLIQTLDLQERIAFKMFLQDQPEATKEQFDSSPDRSRYIGYATLALQEVMAPEAAIAA